MANTKPKTKTSAFTMRTDPEFIAAVGDIMRLMEAVIPPSQSDAIRHAVFETRDRLVKKAAKR